MSKLSRGFTLTEVLYVIFFIASLSLAGVLLWAAAHFIMKLW